MRTLIILLFLFSPFILIGQNMNGTYENESISFINKMDSSQNFSADDKFKIDILFNENQGKYEGQFVIQNLEYTDEIVVFKINKLIRAIDQKELQAIEFDVMSEGRMIPASTKLILYKQEDSVLNMVLDAKEYTQAFYNLILRKK